MEESQGVEVLNILIPVVGVIFLIAVGVLLLNQYFRKSLVLQKLREEELKNRQQQELLQTSLAVQENERKRIAQDLHDELGATLSISRMHLMKLEQNPDLGDGIKSSILNVRAVTESALTSMRRISHELMPAQLGNFGLIKTLQGVVNQINETHQIKVTLAADTFSRLEWEVEVSLYRIVMELINNTIKHANATEITIDLKLNKNVLELIYADNGVGMVSKSDSSQGLGLKNLLARSNAINGSFELMDGNGFGAKVSVPINRNNE